MSLLEDLDSLAISPESSVQVKGTAVAATAEIQKNAKQISSLEAELNLARSLVHEQTAGRKISRLSHALHNASPDVVGLLGALILSAGAGLVYRPAGLIVFGVLLVCSAIAAARAG